MLNSGVLIWPRDSETGKSRGTKFRVASHGIQHHAAENEGNRDSLQGKYGHLV